MSIDLCVFMCGEGACTHRHRCGRSAPAMGVQGCVCPSVCSECACLCPLGLQCPQVTEAADCRACYDMFIGLSTLMHF